MMVLEESQTALLKRIKECRSILLIEYGTEDVAKQEAGTAFGQLIERIRASNDLDEIRLQICEALGEHEEALALRRWLDKKHERARATRKAAAAI